MQLIELEIPGPGNLFSLLFAEYRKGEAIFQFTKYNRMAGKTDIDVIIIGGSYSGLSAAMALGRSMRNVLIIDSGLPCNRQTPHSHNFITQDGEKPNIIAEQAKSQVLNYSTVKFLNGLAVGGKKSKNEFAITTQSGEEFTAKKLIFATGIKDNAVYSGNLAGAMVNKELTDERF